MTATAQPRTLRPYQHEAVDAVLTDWGAGHRRVGVVLPTGAGKSTVIGKLALESHRRGLPVVLLAHRGELLGQMLDAVHAVDPTLPAGTTGTVQAEHNEASAPIVAASLQTLSYPHRLAALGERPVIIWDEVHHLGAKTWHDTITALGAFDGRAWMCGLTATLRRDDGVRIADTIEKVSYERDLKWAIESGYLVRPHGLTVKLPDLDLSQVRTVAGDFAAGELAEVMEASTDTAVLAIHAHAADRRAIIFAAGVDAAHALADALSASGIGAEAVTGAMHRDVRAAVYDRYRSGQTQMLVTVQVLTEGADFPMCDAVVIARPTQSQVLYSQMVGRALRLHEGKTDALVLDLAGTTRVLSLVTLTELYGEAQTRTVDEHGEEVELDELPEDTPAGRVRRRREGPVDMTKIDLLDESARGALWLETPGGIPFIPAGEELVFLWPGTTAETVGFWRAGWMTGRGRKTGEWVGEWGTLAEAAADGEAYATARGTLPSRHASWRRSQAPSEAQLRFARRLGIPDAAGKTKARLSDDISIALAAPRLDGR